jgi:PPOX class probable FMN-dependent enzyme
VRRAIALLHRYVGLGLAGFLFVAGLTGSAIAFHDELDAWLNPALFRVASAGAPLPPAELAARIERADPRLRVQGFSLRTKPGHSLTLEVEPRDPAAALGFDQVFVDPVTARVLGRRTWGECCFQRERLIPFLYSVHYSLHVPGEAGVIFMGLVALAWLLDCFVALALTLPRGRPFWRRWKSAWRIEAGASRYRLLHDLHQSLGLWTWVVLLVLAFSGVAMNLREELFRPLVALVSPLAPTPLEAGRAQGPAAEMPRIGIAEAIATARRVAQSRGWPSEPDYVFHWAELGGYGVGLARPGEDGASGLGLAWLYLSDGDARLISAEIPGTGSAGDVFEQLQFPLHSGHLLGLPGRIAIAATGVAVAVLSGTGVYIWGVKRAARRAGATARAASNGSRLVKEAHDGGPLPAYRLQTLAQVRAIIGEEIPGLRGKLNPTLDEDSLAFLAKSPFALLATSDAQGRPDVSPKGDGPGFVVAEDERTLLIPEQKGNRLIFTLQNILATSRVALIFLVPGTGETLRVHGRAELTADPAALARLEQRGKPALLAIRVHVEQCFFHCAKAFIRSRLWSPDTWPANLRISFGAMFAKKTGAGPDLAARVDATIAEDYRSGL